MLMVFLSAKQLYVVLHEPPSQHEAPSCTDSYSPTYCSTTSPGPAHVLSLIQPALVHSHCSSAHNCTHKVFSSLQSKHFYVRGSGGSGFRQQTKLRWICQWDTSALHERAALSAATAEPARWVQAFAPTSAYSSPGSQAWE